MRRGKGKAESERDRKRATKELETVRGISTSLLIWLQLKQASKGL